MIAAAISKLIFEHSSYTNCSCTGCEQNFGCTSFPRNMARVQNPYVTVLDFHQIRLILRLFLYWCLCSILGYGIYIYSSCPFPGRVIGILWRIRGFRLQGLYGFYGNAWKKSDSQIRIKLKFILYLLPNIL